jgi:hypothetical protein
MKIGNSSARAALVLCLAASSPAAGLDSGLPAYLETESAWTLETLDSLYTGSRVRGGAPAASGAPDKQAARGFKGAEPEQGKDASVPPIPGIAASDLGRPVSREFLAGILEDAEADRPELEKIVGEIQDRNAVDGKTGRGFHHSGIVSGQAEFRPVEGDPILTAALKDGAFASGRTGSFRFSHGQPKGDEGGQPRDQRSSDVRGFAVVLDGQGLTLTNQRTQIVPTGLDFLVFFNEMGKSEGARGAISLPSRWVDALGAKKTARALGKLIMGVQPIADLTRAQYWGPAIVVGRAANGGVYVARPTLIPVQGVTAEGAWARMLEGVRHSPLFERDPQYLRAKALKTLESGDVAFELGLQFYRDEERTPLKADGDKPWDAPVVNAGLVVLPRQAVAASAEARIEEANFGPQVVDQTVAEPAVAAGEFQAHRRIAYEASAKRRGAR